MFGTRMKTTPSQQFGMREKKGRFGLELELEGRFPPEMNIPGGWTTHRDGSVPNGIEFVTTEPHGLGGIENRLTELNKAFKDCGAQIANTHRGSTHIHFNVSRESWINILGLLILHTMIEPVFMRMCGGFRDGNLFCLTSYDTGDIHMNFQQLVNHVAYPESYGFPFRGKYSSLNINPIPDLGSVEFRCFPPTTDSVLITRWCHWIENMMSVVKGENDLTYRELVMNIKRDPTVLMRVFREDVQMYCRPHSVHELIMFGSRTAHEMRRYLSQAIRNVKENEE